MGFIWRSAATLVIVLVVLVNDWSCESIVDGVLCSSWESMVGVVGTEIFDSSSFWVAVIRSAIALICLGCNKDLWSQRSKYKSYGALRGCDLGVRDCLQVYCGK